MTLQKINNTLEKHLSFNRWEFLYQYAIKVLDQDIGRFHKLDEKISKFITTVTIIISVFIATVSFVFTNHIPPDHPLEWLLSVLLFLTLISLCSMWSFLFRGLRLQNVPRMPFNKEIIELFKSGQNDNTILFDLSRTCLKAFDENKIINSKKVYYLNKAYDDTVYASSFIVADLFIVAILQLLK